MAAYSIEGKSSKDFRKTLDFVKANQDETHFLLSRLTDACFLYLRKQVQSGANVIQIFDSWANILNNKELEEYSINYTKSLIDALKNDEVTSEIPIILFYRDPKCNADTLINTSADCISLYWGMNNFDINLAKGKAVSYTHLTLPTNREV